MHPLQPAEARELVPGQAEYLTQAVVDMGEYTLVVDAEGAGREHAGQGLEQGLELQPVAAGSPSFGQVSVDRLRPVARPLRIRQPPRHLTHLKPPPQVLVFSAQRFELSLQCLLTRTCTRLRNVVVAMRQLVLGVGGIHLLPLYPSVAAGQRDICPSESGQFRE
jgi:hypothetical protein